MSTVSQPSTSMRTETSPQEDRLVAETLGRDRRGIGPATAARIEASSFIQGCQVDTTPGVSPVTLPASSYDSAFAAAIAVFACASSFLSDSLLLGPEMHID